MTLKSAADHHRTSQAPTINASVIRLDVSFFHFAILDDQGVALGAVVPKDRSGIECQVKVFGELAGRISYETDLLVYCVRDEALDCV